MNIKLLDFKKVKDFPLASAIESFDTQLYLVGNRSADVIKMSKSWQIDDTIHLFSFATKNISSTEKTDFKASTIVQLNKTPYLVILETGCGTGHDKGILINLKSKKLEETDLSVFYNRLKQSGIEDLNIQAAAVLDDKFILYTNGTKAPPDNRLLVTSLDFWKNQEKAEFYTIKLELEEKQERIISFTGLTYSYQNDWLILTAISKSSEPASNNGSSVQSQLSVIEDASRKIGRKRLKLNEIFNISKLDKKLEKIKMNSLCIQADKEKRLKLHLSATGENDETFLVKLRLKE